MPFVDHKYHMRALLVIAVALFLGSCKPDQSRLAADNLSGTVLIINLGSENKEAKSAKPEEDGGGLGTGFFVDDNLIVTNAHVVGGAKALKVYGYRDNKAYDAELIAADKKADLAIIKVKDWKGFNAYVKPTILRWKDSRSVEVGDTVWAMGNPYGLVWTVSQGLVSHKLRQAKRDRSYYIQTTTPIYPGNSGGPLLDGQGYVIAVNSAIVGKEGYFGMSIPSNYAQKVVEDLRKDGKVNRALIGIRISDSDDEHKVKVQKIEMSSASITAGLLPNDVIDAVKTSKTNKRWINIYDADDLISETMLLSPGDMLDLRVLRDGDSRTFSFPVKGPTEDPSAARTDR